MQEELSDTDMSKLGSIACMTGSRITNLFNCILSSFLSISLTYLILLLLAALAGLSLNPTYQAIGYISIIALFSGPIGLYGSTRTSYWAIITYFILASLHLYALALYIWFNVKSDNKEFVKLNLHQIGTVVYLCLLIASFVMVNLKLLSSVLSIEPAKVIVVDNNPLD